MTTINLTTDLSLQGAFNETSPENMGFLELYDKMEAAQTAAEAAIWADAVMAKFENEVKPVDPRPEMEARLAGLDQEAPSASTLARGITKAFIMPLKKSLQDHGRNKLYLENYLKMFKESFSKETAQDRRVYRQMGLDKVLRIIEPFFEYPEPPVETIDMWEEPHRGNGKSRLMRFLTLEWL